MSMACLRVYVRHRLAPGAQGYAAPTSASRSRERKNEGPVLQYVGKLRKPNHKVFIWGFSYTGALGIPSFVVPDSGRKKPRKYQLTSYRLETEQQCSVWGTMPMASVGGRLLKMKSTGGVRAGPQSVPD
ncbi:RCC1-like G exchanging factor-like protein [Salmo salar]|uniref:RCC1-like G exchanging factor-like protein n=1 Tax=Salmo salar TaxID=8030 RepID=A0ABM3CS91_SALSA|nr:RCC1-like G exchanging factor-like protein [Salmo salar]